MKSYDYDSYKEKLLSNPATKKEYDTIENDFLLAEEIIQYRKDKNYTQKELAQKIGTSQPAIARLESGSYNKVSLGFLRRVANALDAVPEIHLKKRT
jgi:predicted transcriptional regulator